VFSEPLFVLLRIKSFYWSNASNKYKTPDTRYASKNPVAASRHRYIVKIAECSSKNNILAR
jgi:hypothetical protein